MKFARLVFTAAGVAGLVILLPLYFMFEQLGTMYPPPINHPEMFYGFLAVTVAWQLAFLVIASDPVRYRPLMLPAMVEKFLYVATLVVLFQRGSITAAQLAPNGLDLLWGALFVLAFVKTKAGSR
jgi:hypothetical protein